MNNNNSDFSLSLKLFVVLHRACYALQNSAASHIASHNLILTDFAILECLLHKGDLPICAIGNKILLANASMTAAIDRLEKRQLVQRINLKDDRRTKLISLTEKGRVLISEIFEKHKIIINEATSGLDENEKLQAINLLKKLGLKATLYNSTN